MKAKRKHDQVSCIHDSENTAMKDRRKLTHQMILLHLGHMNGSIGFFFAPMWNFTMDFATSIWVDQSSGTEDPWSTPYIILLAKTTYETFPVIPPFLNTAPRTIGCSATCTTSIGKVFRKSEVVDHASSGFAFVWARLSFWRRVFFVYDSRSLIVTFSSSSGQVISNSSVRAASVNPLELCRQDSW